jgi:hypothetical protein
MLKASGHGMVRKTATVAARTLPAQGAAPGATGPRPKIHQSWLVAPTRQPSTLCCHAAAGEALRPSLLHLRDYQPPPLEQARPCGLPSCVCLPTSAPPFRSLPGCQLARSPLQGGQRLVDMLAMQVEGEGVEQGGIGGAAGGEGGGGCVCVCACVW